VIHFKRTHEVWDHRDVDGSDGEADPSVRGPFEVRYIPNDKGFVIEVGSADEFARRERNQEGEEGSWPRSIHMEMDGGAAKLVINSQDGGDSDVVVWIGPKGVIAEPCCGAGDVMFTPTGGQGTEFLRPSIEDTASTEIRSALGLPPLVGEEAPTRSP